MQVNGLRWQKLARKISLAIDEACMAIYTDKLQALKGEPLSFGFSTDGLQFLHPQYPAAGLLQRIKFKILTTYDLPTDTFVYTLKATLQ